MIERGPGSVWFKKFFVGGKTLALGFGNAVHEFETIFLEPALHFTERVLRLVRILILVEKPRLLAALIRGAVPDLRIQKLHAIARDAEHPAPEIGRQTAVFVVKPNQNETAALHQLADGLKSKLRIAGVVQHSNAHHEIKTF